jgi:hypothetical protein
MRFESDNGSNSSVVVESSYSFSSEPNRSLVNSTQKPTASIVQQNSLKKRPLRGIAAFVVEIKCNAREVPGPRLKLSSNCCRSATEVRKIRPRKALTPWLVSVIYSVFTRSRNMSSFLDQTHRATAWLSSSFKRKPVPRTNHSLDETTENPETDLTAEIPNSK